jgi:CBS domain-containing protein
MSAWFRRDEPREDDEKPKEERMPGKTVRDAMTASPTAIASDKTVVDAARTMTTEDVGSLPVVENQKLVGMVTDRDLVINVLAKDLDPHKVPIADVATQDPVSVAPDEPLDTALQRMAEAQVRRLPVVEDGRLVGILAQADVSRASKPESTGRMVEEISES